VKKGGVIGGGLGGGKKGWGFRVEGLAQDRFPYSKVWQILEQKLGIGRDCAGGGGKIQGDRKVVGLKEKDQKLNVAKFFPRGAVVVRICTQPRKRKGEKSNRKEGGQNTKGRTQSKKSNSQERRNKHA